MRLLATSTAFMLLLLGGSSEARARTLTAGTDAATVQATVDLAESGDVVMVPARVWREHVRVDKTITLRGAGDGAVLDGGGEGTVLRVSAPGAVVERLEVRGSGSDLGAPDVCIYTEPSAIGVVVSRNRLRDCAFGIWIHESDEARVEGNDVLGREHIRPTDRGNGIHLFDASRLVIRDNVVVAARDGIYVSACEDSLIEGNRTERQRYGVHYMFSYRNTLRGNESSDNLGGLALMQSHNLIVVDNIARRNERHGLLFRDAKDCVINGNVLEGNGQGMFFFSSTDNEIRGNRLVHNEIGAKIWAGSVRNRVTENEFIGNRQQIFYVGSSDLVWGESGGNYWSDYVGWDQDSDGFGDRPYRLDSFTSRTIHRFPAAVLLLRSPALELLAHLEERLPLLRVPTVVDRAPVLGGRR